MRTLIALAAMLSFATAAQAAPITVTFTSPVNNNRAGDCSLPPILSPGSDPLWCHDSIPNLGVNDSIWIARNVRVPRTYLGADSTKAYKIFVWCTRQIGSLFIRGCMESTTVLPKVISGPLPPMPPSLEQ
jgi:hypothetical protein